MNIKKLRTKTKMTQKEFGEYFNISHRTIEKWEQGERTPPKYVVELIEYKIKKERLRMTNILRSKEDGTLVVAYRGMDLDDYYYITIEEFIEEVESADMWDDIEKEVYEEALSEAGLDYSDYDDPDIMWEDFLKAVNK